MISGAICRRLFPVISRGKEVMPVKDVLEILRQALTILLLAGQIVELWRKIKRATFKRGRRR